MESKEFILHLLEVVAKYIGHIIAIICLLQIYVVYYIKRNEFFTSLRGKDLSWQLLEISAIAWYMLFPMLVVVNLFGLHVDAIIWGSMDFIYVANLGMKRADKYIESKYPKNEDKNNKEIKEDEAD
jgi:hypothetical protein